MQEPTAATVLADLHVSHPAFLKNFASARYVVWAGSGVSFGRYPLLTEVLGRVLAFLWRKRTDNHHLDALERILKLVNAEAMLACEEPTDFPDYEKVVAALTDQYSRVFNEPVSGQDDPDYLLWVAADFPATFMAEAEPNSEHLCLALLMREGFIESVVSTNWDCLIELRSREEITSSRYGVSAGSSLPAGHHGPPVSRLDPEQPFHGVAQQVAGRFVAPGSGGYAPGSATSSAVRGEASLEVVVRESQSSPVLVVVQ